MRRVVLFLAAWVLATPAFATGPLWWSGTGCATTFYESEQEPCQPNAPVTVWYDEYGVTGPITWSFGDGSQPVTADAAVKLTHTYTAVGTYPLSVSVNGSVRETWKLAIGYATFQFASYAASATEGSPASVTVLRSRGGPEGSVSFATKNGTAASGVRYTATTSTVTFPSGELSKTIQIPLIDDARFDDPQDFTIDLTTTSPGFFLARQTNVKVTIKDNDPPPTFSMVLKDYKPKETDGSCDVTIARTGDLLRRVNVGWHAGGPLVTASGIATFDPGETSKKITVPIGNDDIYTGREEALFHIDSADASGIVVFPSVVNIDVQEDEPPPTISIADATVVEGDSGTADCVMTVTLSGKVASADIGFYEPAATGTYDVDFRSYIPTLHFAPSSTTGTLHLTINGDQKIERNETITVRPQALGLKTGRDGVCTIVDDDSALLPEVLHVREGVADKLTLAWGEPLAAPATVNVSATGGVSVPATVTASPGLISTPIPLTASDGGTVTATMQRPGMDPVSARVRIAVSGSAPVVEPQLLSIRSGATGKLTFSLSPPKTAPADIALASGDTSVATVPAMITVPAGGTADVQVNALNAGETTITASVIGGMSITIPISVTLASRPELDSLSPASGSVAGGTRVTLHGDGFEPNCTVLFDYYAATDVVVSDAQTMSVTAPEHGPGSGPVTLNCGPYAITLNDGFTWFVPRRRPR